MGWAGWGWEHKVQKNQLSSWLFKANDATPTSPPAWSWLALHHKSPGCCSCDWIIYNSNLTFLTRKHHTKEKVMKSHLSCLSLTPICKAFQKPLWLKEGREKPAVLHPCLSPSPSLVLSVTHTHTHTFPLTLHSLPHTFPHVFFLCHTFVSSQMHGRFCSLSLPLTSPCLGPSYLPDTPHTSLPFSFHHHPLPV